MFRTLGFLVLTGLLTPVATAQVRVGNTKLPIQIDVQGGPGRIQVSYQDSVKVLELVTLLADVSGKNVIIKTGGEKVVTFYARGEFAKSEVYELIVSALSTVDLGLEHHGRYIRIIDQKRS